MDAGYLPPEPPGPEPDVGGGQQPPQAPPPPQQQPPRPYSPPYGYTPPPGYPPPAAPGWQQPYPPPPGGYYGWAPPPPPQPGNGLAVAGLVTSSVSAFLCLTSAGILSPLTLAGGIVGMVLSRKGKQKVEAGETTKHKDLATAGWWVGIAVLVLSVISIIAWTVLIIVAANSDSTDSSPNVPFDNSRSSAALLGFTAVRAVARLVS